MFNIDLNNNIKLVLITIIQYFNQNNEILFIKYVLTCRKMQF